MLSKTSLKWGLYLGLATSLGTQILTWMGLGLTNWFVFLTYVFVILFVALGLRNIKHLEGGKLRFPKAALAVLIIILLSRFIFQFYMFIYTQYVEPTWVDTVSDSWTLSMQEAGKLSPEQIAAQIKGFQQAYKPFNMFTVEIIKYGLPQMILGLIVSVFFVFKLRKNNT